MLILNILKHAQGAIFVDTVYMMQQYHLIFLSMKELTPEAIIYKLHNHSVHYDLRKHFFSAHIVNIWNSLPNSVVDACTVKDDMQ